MHILFLPSWYATADKPWRGMFVRDQALALTRAGVKVGIAFVERRSLSRLNPAALLASHFQTVSREDDGVPTLRMKGWSTFAQTVPGALVWVHLMQRLVRSYVEMYGPPDVIHAHAALWGGHAAMVCARELGIPYMVTEHSSAVLTGRLNEIEQQDAAAVYDGAAAVVAVSDALAKSVDALAGRAVARVVPNAVDIGYFHLPPSRRRTMPFTFLAVLDLARHKNVEILIRAFARLRARNPRVRLVVAGAGKNERRLRRLTQSLHAQRVVQFAGALPRWQVRQWMWDANALVLPSDAETFGVVLIEALSTGLPVIATRCGGPEEIVTPDVGTLVERNDEEALLRAMEEQLSRRVDPLALRESARRRFDYPVIAERLRALYENVPLRRKEVA
jgi:glycosyltransferase involved in cell wall biosynthesis